MPAPISVPCHEKLAADWIVRLDEALRALDPTLGVIDFDDRLVPARFDHDEPSARYDMPAARLSVFKGIMFATFMGEPFREPERLAAVWHHILDAES